MDYCRGRLSGRKMAAQFDYLWVFEGSSSAYDVISLSQYDGPIGPGSDKSRCYHVSLRDLDNTRDRDFTKTAVEEIRSALSQLVSAGNGQIAVRFGKMYFERHSNIPAYALEDVINVSDMKSTSLGRKGKRHFQEMDLVSLHVSLEDFFRENNFVRQSATNMYSLQLLGDGGPKIDYDQDFTFKAYYPMPWDDRRLACMVKRKDPSYLDMRFVLTIPDPASKARDIPEAIALPSIERDGGSLRITHNSVSVACIRSREVNIYESVCAEAAGFGVKIKVTRSRVFWRREKGSPYFDPREPKEEISLMYNIEEGRNDEDGIHTFVKRCFDFERRVNLR